MDTTQEDRSPAINSVERDVRELLSASVHFTGRIKEFTFTHVDEVLIIEGIVPTYYLKQLLQELLGKLHYIQQIDNRVEVICCDGLSGDRTVGSHAQTTANAAKNSAKEVTE
ncbi:hypothetical protein [Lacipirellula sp.]|uniref:hypothetical protein n=1 Tax=Lacipirellula sp. TaxID=2691419 RepID=UPI003D11CDBE